MQRHHDLIKAHAMRWTTFVRQHATMHLICEVTDNLQYILIGAVILLGRTNMFRFNNPVEAAKMKKELKKVILFHL